MQPLRIKFGTQICLRSKQTNKYFEYNISTKSANAQAPPPSIQLSRQKSSPLENSSGIQNETLAALKAKTYSRYRIVDVVNQTSSSKQSNNELKEYLCFGSKVHLINEHDQYLISSSNAVLLFDKPSLNDQMNILFFKSATFVINDKGNSPTVGFKPITVYDELVIKNVHGHFLVCLESQEVITSKALNVASSRVVWNIMKADVPLIPQWIYTRDTFCKFMLLQGQRDKKAVGYQRIQKNTLANQSAFLQEVALIQDIFDVMLGFEGVYIKRRPNSYQFEIEPHLQQPSCSVALSQLAIKILDLPSYYYVIQGYVSSYSIEQGTVCQALCGGLRQLIKEYKMMVVQLDQQAARQGLTLQKMWFYVQSSIKVMRSMFQLVRQAEKLKGGQLISCIMRLLHATTDESIISIYNFLFAKTLRIYISLISQWIYHGVVQDKHQQFLIVADDSQSDWTSWQDRYSLRRQQIPTLFEKSAQTILVTGKYLNVIKACNKMPEHPFLREIQKNMERSMRQQDFTDSIHKAYDWASQFLMVLVFKEYQLGQVLKSMKGYFFMEFGDFFVHFMEVAEQDLLEFRNKKAANKLPVSVEKLQSLFELLLRTSSANNDPFKDDVSCRLDTASLYEQVHRIKTLEPETFHLDYSEKAYMKSDSRYADFFTLDYKCEFPLNLIINRRAMSKYQAIFRLLFWSKFIESQLNNIWLALQATRDIPLPCFRQAYSLHQKMSNYAKNLVYYLSYQTIQQNWLELTENLKKVKTFQDIIKYHDQFLNKCLVESLLTNKTLLPTITVELGSTCQSFLSLKTYLQVLTEKNKQFASNPTDSIIMQRRKRSIENTQKITQLTEAKNFKTAMDTCSHKFDDSMRTLLREIYSMVGKQEGHLVGFLERLDEEKFYNRKYFQNAFNYTGYS